MSPLLTFQLSGVLQTYKFFFLRDKNSLFEMEYLPRGRVALKAANGLYVNSRKLGALGANSETVGEEEQLQLLILNRPIMVFRSAFGFMGTRNNRVECNMVTYVAFTVETAPSGHYHLKGEPPIWLKVLLGAVAYPVFSLMMVMRAHESVGNEYPAHGGIDLLECTLHLLFGQV